MTAQLLLEQTLNGIQFGVFLFLIAAGLTLVFGIMNMVNLAHGSLYMMGAYYAMTFVHLTGSFLLALVLTIPCALLTGIVLEIIALRTLYNRDHMDQVLATFGLILFFNELVRLVWGAEAQSMPMPPMFDGTVEIIPGVPYPVFRLIIILVGVLMAIFLFFLIARTRIGMLIRAGASNRTMVSALGINIRLLYTLVFGLGAALAGIAGAMAGIGSIRGAVVAAIIVGVVETVGRSTLPYLLSQIVSSDQAQTAGPAIASMLIYVLMAGVLFFKPEGLFPARTG